MGENDVHRGRSGFTLIELSIVLVVIGLIVGGVLVGQSLMVAATARSEIKQIQDLQTQIMSFYGKFGCLPGDCTNATAFFGSTDSAGHSIRNGDGDGLIRSSTGPGGPYTGNECVLGGVTGSELPQVFLQLNDSGTGNYVSDGSGYSMNTGWGPLQAINNGTGLLVTCLSSDVWGTTGDNTYPLAIDSSLISGNVIVLGAYANPLSGNNRVGYVTGIGGDFGTNAASLTSPVGIPINLAQMIDRKIDDGLPNSGRFGVIAASGSNPNNSGTTPACLTNSNTSYPGPSGTCTATVGALLGQ